MDILRKYWPTPFKIKKGDLASFIIQLVIFVIVCAVASVLIGVLGAIPIVNIVAWVLGLLLDIYSITGIVLCVLKFIGTI